MSRREWVSIRTEALMKSASRQLPRQMTRLLVPSSGPRTRAKRKERCGRSWRRTCLNCFARPRQPPDPGPGSMAPDQVGRGSLMRPDRAPGSWQVASFCFGVDSVFCKEPCDRSGHALHRIARLSTSNSSFKTEHLHSITL